MSQQKTFVYTSIQKEGYHSFPEAATLPEFATGDLYDVNHLSHLHSHIFLIKVWVQVGHQNRQVEFLQLRRWLLEHYADKVMIFSNRSCEMIAEDLLVAVNQRYPNVEIRIEVAEDSINGALLEFRPN